MTGKIKKRLIHFYTHGNITEDFNVSRRKKARSLRRIIHVCFYLQCAAAALCIASAAVLGAGAGIVPVVIGSAAVVVAAFLSVGGGAAEKTVLYILDLVYSVICFAAGALVATGAAYLVCGGVMLLAAVAAFVGFMASYLRKYLSDFAAENIRREDYTLIGGFIEELPAEPPAPKKTEMQELAESLAQKLAAVGNGGKK